jgi:Tfp pilus assembly protein PilV
MRRRGSGQGGRGAVLLEVLLALALFVAVAMTTLGLTDRVIQSTMDLQEAQRAADLARTAMTRLEAGLATPETLSGAVRTEGSEDELGVISEGWEIEVQTSPSRFPELTEVTVRALRRSGETVAAEFTLKQLVRLSREVQATTPEDPLAAMRGDPEAPTP